MAGDTTKLEALIKRYEDAIFGDATTDEVDALSNEVEDEARRIGYENHARLHSIHTMAEMFG